MQSPLFRQFVCWPHLAFEALEQFGDGVAGCGAHYRSDAQQCGGDLRAAQFVADADQIGHAMVFEEHA